MPAYAHEGECPNCGDMGSLDYGVAEITEAGVEYPYTCPQCGFKGREMYEMTFDEITFDSHYDMQGNDQTEPNFNTGRDRLGFPA